MVRLPADLAAAYPHALVNVIIQAGPLLAKVLREFTAAGRQQKGPVGFLHRLLYHHGGDKRPDVFIVVVPLLQRQPDAGILLPGHAHIVVALIILQQNVVLGAVQLDQAAFQHQRLKLAVGHNIIKILYHFHHTVDLRQVPLHPSEVGGHPVFQLFGLAHIDDLAPPVPHQVNPRLHGQGIGFFSQLGYLLHIHPAAPPLCFYYTINAPQVKVFAPAFLDYQYAYPAGTSFCSCKRKQNRAKGNQTFPFAIPFGAWLCWIRTM